MTYEYLVCNVSSAPVFAEPNKESKWSSEVIYGMKVRALLVEDDEFVYCELPIDGYRGYVNIKNFMIDSPPKFMPSENADAYDDKKHIIKIVKIPISTIWSEPDCKSPPLLHLPMHSAVCIVDETSDDENNKWFQEIGGGFIPSSHLKKSPIVDGSAATTNIVDVASRFVYSPYYWGGRTALGLDCSGLVQIVLWHCGIICPRDASQQLNYWQQLAAPTEEIHDPNSNILSAEIIKYGSVNELQKNDLLYWKIRGHVAIVSEKNMLLHANAHDMLVAYDSIDQVIGRTGEKPTAVRLRILK